VFLHFSTLGAGETLYSLGYRKPDPITPSKTIEVSALSTLVPDNPNADEGEDYVFHESYMKNEGDDITISHYQNKTFTTSDIILGSIKKIQDPYLYLMIGTYKNLSNLSAEEYMHGISQRKLKLNRQFEMAIKQTSVDCKINKNGNIIRLEERYEPTNIDNIYRLEYENYSTGVRYKREGIDTLNFDQIMNNAALKFDGNVYYQIGIKDAPRIEFPKSLIVPEDINCDLGDIQYEFSSPFIPDNLIRITKSRQLVPLLKQVSLENLETYLKSAMTGKIKVFDTNLPKKVTIFFKNQENDERKKLIDILVSAGVGRADEDGNILDEDANGDPFGKLSMDDLRGYANMITSASK
jgi:hypothetical protein